ncbi:hypothetical protein M409DRAFT_21325 [Zasmidium cellare ATCC 36951]|uniref:Inorganic phosphate transport PHO88 n=1 Tax=Zasmidium cellare ATCC 36951 TaxID=1080233 RepID=A0A6A6CN60_ZASCE|nr:uncharacterized protein M409DRAFT_21325 [Zasmidium cellare ATCC 36951]KAF2168575.1 hypothetical protein M409DRAFT_21325 [Zasmidium cellare ATCC 36951]
MKPQMQNIIIMASAIVASTQIPFKDPNVLNAARTIYIFINLIVLAILAYTRLRIAQQKDTTLLPPPPPFKPDKPNKPPTIQTHDLHHFTSLLKSQVTSMLMVALMHLYFRLPTPLVIQSILPIKNALESNLVKIYVFGRPAVGELKRPWKDGAGFVEAVGAVGAVFRGGKEKGIEEGGKKVQ